MSLGEASWDSDLSEASPVVVYGIHRAFVGSVSWDSDSGPSVQLGSWLKNDVETVSIVKIVSLNPRVVKLKVKKRLINVSYLKESRQCFGISMHMNILRIRIWLCYNNRHFLSTYFFVYPFELSYWSYDIWREVVDKSYIISYFPSTFYPNSGHHQGRMYYPSDVAFVSTLLLCKNDRLFCCIV